MQNPTARLVYPVRTVGTAEERGDLPCGGIGCLPLSTATKPS